MADQQRPLDAKSAPDPARSYERADPKNESGMGRLDNNMNATPQETSDRQSQAINNDHAPRQINADDVVNDRAAHQPGDNSAAIPPSQPQPDHPMKDEEPLGWDQAPLDEQDPERKRHPRTEGRGGTP